MNAPLTPLQRRIAGAKKTARIRASRALALTPTGPVRSDPVRFTVPGKPRGKGRPRFNPRSPTPYTPRDTVLTEMAIKAAGRLAMENFRPFDGPVSLTVTAIFQQPKKAKAAYPVGRPDSDNVLKLVMDALNKTVWIDDAYVVHAEVIKLYGAEPQLVIHCKSIQHHEGNHGAFTIPSSTGCAPDRPQDPSPAGTPAG